MGKKERFDYFYFNLFKILTCYANSANHSTWKKSSKYVLWRFEKNLDAEQFNILCLSYYISNNKVIINISNNKSVDII